MSDLVQQMREKARGLLDAPFWNACADELAIARASQVGPIQVYIDQLKADRDRLAERVAELEMIRNAQWIDEKMKARFTSGNCIPVERAWVTAIEWDSWLSQLSAARADAERYRWLRASNDNLDDAVFVTMGDYSAEWSPDAEAIIDAGRAAPSAGGPQS